MASYSRILLSGTPSSGRVIPVAATSGTGTLIHTAIDGASGFDEVYLWAANVTGTAATLTINWGGAGASSDSLISAYSIPANSAAMLIADGQVVNGALVVRALSGTANAINISGYVNRIN